MDQVLKERWLKMGSRFFGYQKKQFHGELKQFFEENGYKEQELSTRRFYLLPVRDYIYGDLKRAKVVFTIPYDTPQKILWHKHKYYVNNGTKNQKRGLVQIFVPIIIIYAMFVALTLLSPRIEGIGSFVVALLGIFCMILMIVALTKGFGNKYNATSFTSSLLLAAELAKRLDNESRRYVAFVFTDSNRGICYGDRMLHNELMRLNRTPQIVCLHSLGFGDQIEVGYSSGNRKLASEMVRSYTGNLSCKAVEMKEENRENTSMVYYRKSIWLASGVMDEKGSLVNLHTGSNKDKSFDEGMLDDVLKILVEMVGNIRR